MFSQPRRATDFRIWENRYINVDDANRLTKKKETKHWKYVSYLALCIWVRQKYSDLLQSMSLCSTPFFELQASLVAGTPFCKTRNFNLLRFRSNVRMLLSFGVHSNINREDEALHPAAQYEYYFNTHKTHESKALSRKLCPVPRLCSGLGSCHVPCERRLCKTFPLLPSVSFGVD